MTKSLRIVVDRDLCEANALCVREAPDVFELGDEDYVRCLIERPGEELRALVEKAIERCPRTALSIVEE